MNVPDLRHVDLDAYRQRARELHLEAIELSIDRLVARITALLRHRPSSAPATAARAAC